MAYYKMKNVSKNRLEKLGFRLSELYSSAEENIYTYRFPVYKYREVPTLEAEIMVCLETGEAWINVFDKSTRNRYASWYCKEMGFGTPNKVVDIIEENIAKKIKQLGIEEVTDNNAK